MSVETHGESGRPHRRIHPDKKQGKTRKQKVSAPTNGLGHTSPHYAARKNKAKVPERQKALEAYGKMRVL